MTCERQRPALIEVALGTRPAPELLGHLGECSTCTAELERQRSLLARIDAEIRGGMDVASSPNYRTRARLIASAPAAAPRRFTAWLLPLAAALGVIVLGSLVVRRPTGVAEPPARAVAEQAPRPMEAPKAVPSVPPAAAPTPILRTARRTAAPPEAEPEVFLRPGEREFIERFAEAMRRRPVTAAVLREPGFAGSVTSAAPLASPPLAGLAIPPLRMERGEIKPLTIEPSDASPAEPAEPGTESNET